MPSKKGLSAEPAEEGRCFLIAAGTAHYSYLKGHDLPSVVDDIRLVVDCFQKLGYEQVLPELAENPTHTELAKKLGAWFADDKHSPNDKVVFYYSGHGERYSESGGRFPTLYLLTRDTRKNQIPNTAYSVDTLMASILAPGRVQQGMIILDVCYAGHGLKGMLRELHEWADDFPEQYKFVLIGATRARKLAYSGVFATAFSSAIQDPRFGGEAQAWLDTGAVIQAVNEKTECEEQEARWVFAPAQSGEAPRLIPNPRYVPILDNLETQRYQRDLLEHWYPRARGVEAKSESWHFTGRETVLRKIVAWLTSPCSDGKPFVITGSAGTGKSAILACLVILANPDYRDSIERAGYLNGISSDTVPPKNIVDVAIHARRKTLHDVVEAITEYVNVRAQDAEELIEALAVRTERLVIIVDALDEADESSAIARFLSRLTGNPRLWLLVGSRPDTQPGKQNTRVQNLGNSTVEINLDDFPENSQKDIETYAFHRLLAKGEGRTTPYQGQAEERVRTVARTIGNKAKNVFLIARIICEDLIKAEQPVDVSLPDWDRQFPSSIGEAFQEYLQRFDRLEAIGLSRRKVTDLLRPLAYAEGEGLPWESVWRPLADVLATQVGGKPRRYKDTDIETMLLHVGAFVVESQEHGRSAYRLYHQALADYLRENIPCLAEIQSRITSALIGLVPKYPNGRLDWINPATHPYIRTHLASHAVKGGVLDVLVTQPAFLAAADPIRLLPALNNLTNDRMQTIADIYRHIVHALPMAEPLERMALIHLSACQEAPVLASDMESPVPTAWRCRWAHWMPSTPHRIIGRHDKAVLAVAMGDVDGEPIVVSGSADRTVRLWEVRSGRPHGEPLIGPRGKVMMVAMGEIDGEPIVVSGSADRTVRLWEVRSGRPCGKSLLGNQGRVMAVAMGEIDGEPIVVSGSVNGTVRLWDALSGRPRGKSLLGNQGQVMAVAMGEIDGEPIVVSSSMDGTVRLWDARSGRPRGETLTGYHSGWVMAVALGKVDGEPVLVSGGADGRVLLWNARSGKPRNYLSWDSLGSLQLVDWGEMDEIDGDDIESLSYRRFSCVTAVALGEVHGEPIVVAGSMDGGVWLWDARSCRLRGEPLTGHRGQVTAVALGDVGGEPIVVSGSADGTVRLWVAHSCQSRDKPLTGHTEMVTGVVLGEVEGEPIVVSGNFWNTLRLWALRTGRPRIEPIVVSGNFGGTIRLWDDRSGRLRGEPLPSHTGMVTAVASGEVDGEPIVVSGNQDGTVRLWDKRSGRPRGKHLCPLRGRVTALALGEMGCELIGVSLSENDTVWLWNAHSGRLHCKPLIGLSRQVTTVALGKVDGESIVVSGSWDGTVRLWKARSGRPRGEPLTGHTEMVTSVAIGEMDGEPIVVSGSKDGTVRLWDARNGRPRGESLPVHSGRVMAVALGEVDGEPVLVSGGADGTVRLWGARSLSLLRVVPLDSTVTGLAVGNDSAIVVGASRGLLVLDFFPRSTKRTGS